MREMMKESQVQLEVKAEQGLRIKKESHFIVFNGNRLKKRKDFQTEVEHCFHKGKEGIFQMFYNGSSKKRKTNPNKNLEKDKNIFFLLKVPFKHYLFICGTPNTKAYLFI